MGLLLLQLLVREMRCGREELDQIVRDITLFVSSVVVVVVM